MKIVSSTLATVICVLGGFYTVQMKSGLRLVVINSNLWFTYDYKMANHSDPAGQFVWLEDVLNSAEEQSNLVNVSKLTTNLAAL